MFKFSKKVEYGMMALLEVANHTPEDLVTAKALARQFHIPPEIMGKVLQVLKRNNLLESVQGVNGGYLLRKSLDKISLLDVIEALDGPVNLVSCSNGKFCDCEQLLHCNIKTPLEIIQNELAQFFYSITLDDIRNRYSIITDLLKPKVPADN